MAKYSVIVETESIPKKDKPYVNFMLGVLYQSLDDADYTPKLPNRTGDERTFRKQISIWRSQIAIRDEARKFLMGTEDEWDQSFRYILGLLGGDVTNVRRTLIRSRKWARDILKGEM